MQIRHFLLFFFLLTIHQIGKSQYVVIPDDNFRHVLQASPHTQPVMYNGQLDTTLAANLGNSDLWALYWFDANITDLTGLQYFKKIININIGSNKLIKLPPLPESIRMLDCTKNQLISLPKFPDHLRSIMCQYNQLSTLPDIPPSMNELLCQNNLITNLPSLPDSLYYINCSNNKISSLPVLPQNMTYLYCSQNQLSNLPSLPDSIKYLECENNNLLSLPLMPAVTVKVNCENNRLTFKDIVPNMHIPQFGYAPQDSVDNFIHLNSNLGDTLDFSTTATYSGNVYQWVKNNVALKDSANIAGTNTPILLLKNITAADSGFYSCNITNPVAPLLTLNRRRIRLDIITPKEPLPELIIYQLLSPNHDTDNDNWEISNLEKYQNIEVSISNIWGEVLFHTQNYQNDWNGDNLVDGTYYYKVKAHDTNKTYKGRLVIKR